MKEAWGTNLKLCRILKAECSLAARIMLQWSGGLVKELPHGSPQKQWAVPHTAVPLSSMTCQPILCPPISPHDCGWLLKGDFSKLPGTGSVSALSLCSLGPYLSGKGKKRDLGNLWGTKLGTVCYNQMLLFFLNLKGKTHYYVLIFEVDKLNCWVVLWCLLLRASPCWLFCFFPQDQEPR